MSEGATYVLATALIIIPLMMLWPYGLEILKQLYRMASGAVGTPWP